ncbi:hybrid sensor histidine kinase/response regulator transcription factor [Marinilabilia rubra]|uniref:histidine kinase n=1 Tax=Marinilabilia rubra TaxID=2162893 RepID=A0A2U2B6F0_9BACT|nr:ATP-binding protein [Marinilabilia rubra]PWD98651.1 hybrid sensor histidine kinase/response regulator [Marinilabilia rubra]
MRFYFVFILLLISVVRIGAQTPRFDHFDISTGLSQNNINGLVIDDNGNVWAGTLDGLNKYNGYNFEIFKPRADKDGGISGNHLISMGKGIDGDIWITTRDGVLNQYQASQQKFRRFGQEIFEDAGIAPTSNLWQYNDSMLWFSQGNRTGVLNLNTEECQTFTAPGYVRGINQKGDILLIYGEFGLQEWSIGGDSPALKKEPERISSFPCYFIQKEKGRWLVLSEDGVYYLEDDLNSKTPVFCFRDVGLSDFEPSTLNSFAVFNKDFWIGGFNLLVRIQKNKDGWSSERFSYDSKNDYTFKGYNVTHLKFDELGNLWIGTQKNGINHFNHEKNQFLHYNWNAPSLSRPDADPVRAICRRTNGDLWLGFDRNGVGIIFPDGHQKYFRHYYTKSGRTRPINNVRSIFEDSKGNVWIGESGELCIFNEEKQRIEAVDASLSWRWPHQCYVIKEWESGTLMLTSTQDIGWVDLDSMILDKVVPISENRGYLPGSLRDIVMDENGDYWIAKDENGLFRVDQWDKGFDIIQKSTHQLSDNKVYCMAFDGDSLWIGTNSGLNLYSLDKDKVEKKYFEQDGLSNNIIYSLSFDSSGILWMSTNRGISRFNPISGSFKTYLSNDFFMDDAHFVDADGQIYYGGYTGVVGFHPDEIDPLQVKAGATLENFSLFNRRILPGDTVNHRVLLRRPIGETKSIELKHGQNSFAISFNAYPFDVPNQNVFRYRLAGLQAEWTISDGNNRQARYAAVPPGDYTFEVQAAFSHADYGPVKRLNIEVIPPFWQTGWFKSVMILALLASVFAGYHMRLRQIRKRNVFLKKQVDEQTRELRERNKEIVEISEKLHEADQSKLRFFTNISHDFRTPLTLILAHLDGLGNAKNKTVKTIRNNALRLLNMINQLIDLRKLDQGELALSVSRVDIVAFTAGLVDSFQALALKRGVNLRFFSSLEKLEVWLDIDKTEKILYNLLANALKYTPDGKSVLVSVAERGKQFSVVVQDQGVGMSEDEVNNAFKRFYRSEKGQENAAGHGIGLTIVKGLTEVQKGTIDVESEEGKGSEFILTFLKGRSHFADRDFKNKEDESMIQETDIDYVSERNGFSRFGGKNILVVEDNDELSEFLKDLLERWFTVRIAENGREAFGVMEAFSPDLIISDVMMPVMDGIEFCRRVKADIRTSHIPFILLTARTDAETHIEGFELGVDDYIEKPFDGRIFLARLKALLENREKLKKHFEDKPEIINSGKGLSKRDQNFLQSVNEIIEKRYSETDFGVETLSFEMNMSRSTFYRKFKALTGIAAADYLRKIRLHKASGYLKQEEIPASQVAELVGFQSVAHFRKCFKEEFGETPGAWAK